MGFEPTTRGLKGRCSNLLSYGPSSELNGLVPARKILFSRSAPWARILRVANNLEGQLTPYIIYFFDQKSTATDCLKSVGTGSAGYT